MYTQIEINVSKVPKKFGHLRLSSGPALRYNMIGWLNFQNNHTKQKRHLEILYFCYNVAKSDNISWINFDYLVVFLTIWHLYILLQ